MSKVRKISIKDSIYPVAVLVVIGPYCNETIVDFAKKEGVLGKANCLDDPKDMTNCFGCCWPADMGSVIWLKEPPRGPDWVSMAVHEAVHASFYLGEILGFAPSKDSCEFYTYYTQKIVKEILEKTKK